MKTLTRIACIPLVLIGQAYILLVFATVCLYAIYLSLPILLVGAGKFAAVCIYAIYLKLTK